MGFIDAFSKLAPGIGSVLGFAGNLFGSISQNNSIDAQIAAQREENEKAREFNRQQAIQQNQWNIDQWNRENAYNTPAMQVRRMKEAGLNPNLMYGQGNTGNSAQLSGSLTSAAPAVASDVSALGNRGSTMSKVMSSLGNALMQFPLYREQVKQARERTRGMMIDNNSRESNNDFEALVQSTHLSNGEIDSILDDKPLPSGLARPEWRSPKMRKYLLELRRLRQDSDEKGIKIDMDKIDKYIKDQTKQSVINKIANEEKISSNQVIETMASMARAYYSYLNDKDDYLLQKSLYKVPSSLLNKLNDYLRGTDFFGPLIDALEKRTNLIDDQLNNEVLERWPSGK